MDKKQSGGRGKFADIIVAIVFPVWDGKMVRGDAQEIFFCEFDGAQSRTVYVEIMGES